MEILIVGVILVGLMVYASTRIKRSAALAFEAETIDEADYTVEKPAGFLHVLNGDPALDYEAYSKEIGEGEASRAHAARAELRIYRDRKLDHAVSALRETTKIENEIPEVIGGHRYLVLEGSSETDGILFRESFKLVELGGSVYEFKIKVLESAGTEVAAAADSMLASFTVK